MVCSQLPVFVAISIDSLLKFSFFSIETPWTT